MAPIAIAVLPHAEAIAALGIRGNDGDEDVVVTEFKLPLIDRYSLGRLVIPCRGVDCQHHETFELATFELINRGAVSGDDALCPICSCPTRPQSLRVDELVLRLLEAAPGAAELVVTSDGHWKRQRDDSGSAQALVDLTVSDDEDDDDEPIEVWTEDSSSAPRLMPLSSLPATSLPMAAVSLEAPIGGTKRPRPGSQQHGGAPAVVENVSGVAAVQTGGNDSPATLFETLRAMSALELTRHVAGVGTVAAAAIQAHCAAAPFGGDAHADLIAYLEKIRSAADWQPLIATR